MTNTVLKHLSNIQLPDTTAKIPTWSKATVIYYWLQQQDLASPKDLLLLPYRAPLWSQEQEEYMSAQTTNICDMHRELLFQLLSVSILSLNAIL